MNKEKVNHPKHYVRGGIECIDAIEAWDLGYHLGHAVKYIMRAGYKDEEDPSLCLKKAVWFINRKIGLMIKVERKEKRRKKKR